jgi:hypothetical protein
MNMPDLLPDTEKMTGENKTATGVTADSVSVDSVPVSAFRKCHASNTNEILVF